VITPSPTCGNNLSGILENASPKRGISAMKLEDHLRLSVSQEGYDLFAVFSRFEYAMKKGGFCREGCAEAAWWTFAGAFPASFFPDIKAEKQAEIYFTCPPSKIELISPGIVGWPTCSEVPTDTSQLFDSIQTARNNLFHGDKSHNCDRDTKLMRAALFILNKAFIEAEKHDVFKDFIKEMSEGIPNWPAPDEGR
jgi:hypothetical protein